METIFTNQFFVNSLLFDYTVLQRIFLFYLLLLILISCLFSATLFHDTSINSFYASFPAFTIHLFLYTSISKGLWWRSFLQNLCIIMSRFHRKCSFEASCVCYSCWMAAILSSSSFLSKFCPPIFQNVDIKINWAIQDD